MIAPDPILAAIAAHRAALDAINARPLTDALVDYAEWRRVTGDSQIPIEYFPAILAACRALLATKRATTHPLFDVEDDVLGVVDQIAVVDGLMTACRGRLDQDEIAGIGRIVGDVRSRATRVRTAWVATYGDDANGSPRRHPCPPRRGRQPHRRIRWLIEAARAACRDPDGPSINGMCVLVDVIDDKLCALCEAVHPQAEA